MSSIKSDQLLQMETTCGTLLYELQVIWDEVGETETERDKMLLELERECLEVYRRKVDQANRSRAHLRQAIAEHEAELASICSALGERPISIRQSEQKLLSLKEELDTIRPQLEEMRKRKMERKTQFMEVLEQIKKVSTDIHGSCTSNEVGESDLSTRKLEDMQRQLQSLQMEKSDRLKQVMQHLSSLNMLCSVLGLDFKQTLGEVHPSLSGSEEMYSLSNSTIQRLESAVLRFRELKLQRMQRLQDLGTSMLELWNLMDTPFEEQHAFQHVTRNIAASEEEITEQNTLSLDFIKYVEAEVSRLEELKSSKMKELVLKKRSELEEICRKTHLVPEANVETEHLLQAIESGVLDAAVVLGQIELEIGKVKEEALCRKEILDKVEKWLSACNEESWLEVYEMDDNRYNAGRGAHLTLKRAEKARALVNKLPGMVDKLAEKISDWENERGTEFSYDGVPLLSMLEEYKRLRLEKEEDKKRQREQKKLQGQLIAEQEARYGSKPSPMKLQSGKKSSRVSMGGCGNNRRLSLGGINFQTQRPDSAHSSRATPHSQQPKRAVDDNIDIPSNAKRGLDLANLTAKNYAFIGREPETPITRRPFSPISSTASSRPTSLTNCVLEDPNKAVAKPNDENVMQKQLLLHMNEGSQTTMAAPPYTPVKTVPVGDKENEIRTPVSMKIPPPPTPSTISAPMLTSMTPATIQKQQTHCVMDNSVEEELEYSFEERRLGFVLPGSGARRSIQV